MNELDDVTLVKMFKATDVRVKQERIFEVLMKRYRTFVYRVINKMVRKDIHSRDDLYQETWLKVWRNLHNFKGDSKFSVWLWVVTANLCRSFTKKSMTDPLRGDRTYNYERLIDADEHQDVGLALKYSEFVAGERKLTSKDIELYEAVEAQALSKTSEDAYKSYRLFMEGMTIDQVAEEKQQKVDKVKTQIFRARNKVIKLLKESELYER